MSSMRLIPLENKLKYIILKFHREKIKFCEGADFGLKRSPSFFIFSFFLSNEYIHIIISLHWL